MPISVSTGGIRREPTATARAASTTPQVRAPATYVEPTARAASPLIMTDSGRVSPSDSQATTEGNFDRASAGTIADGGLPSVLGVVSKFRSSVRQELFLSSYLPEFTQSITEIENPPQFTIGRRYLKSDRRMQEQYESIEEEELRFITERITASPTVTPGDDVVDYDKLEFIYSEKEDEVLDYETPFELQLDLEENNVPTVSTYVNSIQARNVNQEDISALQESFEEQFSITEQTTGDATDIAGAGSTPVYTDTGGSIGLGTRESRNVTTSGASETETTRIVSGY